MNKNAIIYTALLVAFAKCAFAQHYHHTAFSRGHSRNHNPREVSHGSLIKTSGDTLQGNFVIKNRKVLFFPDYIRRDSIKRIELYGTNGARYVSLAGRNRFYRVILKTEAVTLLCKTLFVNGKCNLCKHGMIIANGEGSKFKGVKLTRKQLVRLINTYLNKHFEANDFADRQEVLYWILNFDNYKNLAQ